MFKELQAEEALLALGLLAAPLVFKVILASKATNAGTRTFAEKALPFARWHSSQ
jgi:hypothetical protein